MKASDRSRDDAEATWTVIGIVALLVLVAMLTAVFLSSCGMPITICYEHETYGRVCVTLYGGKVTEAKTPEGSPVPEPVRLEIEKKLAGGSP